METLKALISTVIMLNLVSKSLFYFNNVILQTPGYRTGI